MQSVFRKHLTLVPQYFRLARSREAEYKVGFYTFILNQVVSIAVWLVFWRILMDNFGPFGRWSYEHVVLLTGFVSINSGLWLTFIAIWRLPGEILTGALNSHLIKPVQPFVHVIFKNLNLRSFPRILMGAGIVVFGIVYFDLAFDSVSIVLASCMSMLSFLSVFIPLAMIGLSAFWIGRAEFLRDLFVELLIFQNYPLTEFPNPFILVFTFILPLIFSGTVPVLILTLNFSVWQSLLILLLLLVIVVGQLLLFRAIWNRGLKRYESYGG